MRVREDFTATRRITAARRLASRPACAHILDLPVRPTGCTARQRRVTPAAGGNIGSSSNGSSRRSVVILPGLGNNAADYARLSEALAARGYHVETAPVTRLDWARNAAGLRYAEYWAGELAPLPTVNWYLDRISTAVEAASVATARAPMTLLCHSAGGWLGRVWMLERSEERLAAGVDAYVSLGSPQVPPPPGVVDQTRGILSWCLKNCPGGLHPEVTYASVAGRYITGAPLLGPGTWQQRVVGLGYQQVCGDASAVGDGVVPLPAAHLPEGQGIRLDLDEVYHSPLGAVNGRALESVAATSGEGSSQGAQRLWYGSQGVLERWLHLLDPTTARSGGVAATEGSFPCA